MNENDFVTLDIVNEEDLPQSILESLTEQETSQSTVSNSPGVDTSDQQGTNSSIVTTSDLPDLTDVPLFDLTPPAPSTSNSVDIEPAGSECSLVSTADENNVESQQTNEATGCDMESSNHRHSKIRKRATETYLSNANKKIKIHEQLIEDLSANCNIGDYVGIKINKVDRTNTDPKILASVVIEKKQNKIKVACEHGIINQWWSVDSLVQLSSVPEALINLKTSELKEISFITASRYFIRGGINGVTCSCKGGCRTKQCACRKKNISCSTKCHKNGSCCTNLE